MIIRMVVGHRVVICGWMSLVCRWGVGFSEIVVISGVCLSFCVISFSFDMILLI